MYFVNYRFLQGGNFFLISSISILFIQKNKLQLTTTKGSRLILFKFFSSVVASTFVVITRFRLSSLKINLFVLIEIEISALFLSMKTEVGGS